MVYCLKTSSHLEFSCCKLFQIAEDFGAIFPHKGDKMASVWPAVSRQLLPQLKRVKNEKKLVAAVLSAASESSGPGIIYMLFAHEII